MSEHYAHTTCNKAGHPCVRTYHLLVCMGETIKANIDFRTTSDQFFGNDTTLPRANFFFLDHICWSLFWNLFLGLGISVIHRMLIVRMYINQYMLRSITPSYTYKQIYNETSCHLKKRKKIQTVCASCRSAQAYLLTLIMHINNREL